MKCRYNASISLLVGLLQWDLSASAFSSYLAKPPLRYPATTNLLASVEEEEIARPLSVQPADAVKGKFPSAETITIELNKHKPLGCTVEESMDSASEYVFVTKVVQGGLADQAGIQVGDLIVAVTGLFGDLTIVLDSGVEQIKGLVSSVPEENMLTLSVARGTDVMERHESALVDLCSFPGSNDKEVEGCIVDFIKDGYNLDRDDDDGAEVSECGDEDVECLIDDMMNMWADDLPPPSPSINSSEGSEPVEATKMAKPWSSRSSPSGTYVRDPVTGEMKNIDSTDW